VTRRILYLIETLGHGGAEHQLVATVLRLDRSRFEPIVAHFRGPDYLAARLRASGVRVVNLNVPAGKQHWPELVLRIRSLIRSTHANLLHTSLLEADVLGGIAGHMTDVPVMSTLCNIAGDPVRLRDNPRNNRLKFTVTNWVWGGALRAYHRRSVAISEAVRASAVDTFGLDSHRIRVIYRGMDDDRPPLVRPTDTSALKQSIGLAGADPLILSVGRLAPQKGHKYLVQALPRLVARFPNTKLAIVGEGWLGPALRQLATQLGVGDQLLLLGKRTDVPELLAACDAFVFPSLFEGLGVSLLEACYAGCLCIGTNTGPLPEIIEHQVNGLLVPPADSAALGAALLEVLGDRAGSRRMGDAAQRSAQRRFMLSDKVQDLQACYEELLRR
jgi:glycosyltransferase involved in cell wall biosynthesis